MRTTSYRSIDVNHLSIFYREDGSPDAPTLLLLHGFPSSSRMYEPLFTHLADAFHLVAPDYPGFGHSDAPDPMAFNYTFDNLARIVERFTELLRLDRYSLFVQDYGGPVGFASQPRIPIDWLRWWSKTRSRTKTAWGRFGRPVASSGPTAPATKLLSGRTSCLSMPLASDT